MKVPLQVGQVRDRAPARMKAETRSIAKRRRTQTDWGRSRCPHPSTLTTESTASDQVNERERDKKGLLCTTFGYATSRILWSGHYCVNNHFGMLWSHYSTTISFTYLFTILQFTSRLKPPPLGSEWCSRERADMAPKEVTDAGSISLSPPYSLPVWGFYQVVSVLATCRNSCLMCNWRRFVLDWT